MWAFQHHPNSKTRPKRNWNMCGTFPAQNHHARWNTQACLVTPEIVKCHTILKHLASCNVSFIFLSENFMDLYLQHQTMAQAKVEPFVRIDVQTKRGSGVAFQLLTSIASALMCTPMPIIQLTSRSLMATPHGRF